MASKEDDTLPLPVLSLEYSVDPTADEDFIPTSQPPGNSCSKVTRISGTPPQNQSSNTSAEEPNTSAAPTDDTLPREAVIHPRTLDTDKSSDFIPDTEIKTIQTVHVKNEPSCRKKLSVFPDDIASQAQSSPLWETHQFSLLNGSPVEAKPSRQDTPNRSDKSIAEIIVNDSAETVDLEGSPTKGAKLESGAKTVETLSVECSINSDAGRCEETQIFDNSSVLLLEQPGHLIADQSEKSIKAPTPSQDLYLANTIENESDLQEHLLVCPYSPPAAAAETTRGFNQEFGNATRSKENGIPKGAPGVTLEDETSVTMRKMDFKLTVTCFVSFNPKTNKVLQKFISKVNEAPKPLPKPAHWDHLSDYTSDKSKRYSTSSSGSVYSDKHGLPFGLPKRVSAVSDQTDSSEEDLGARIVRTKNKALGRTPWSNEYLLPMKLDELVQASIESQLMMERVSSLREPKGRGSADTSIGKETVKSSSSEAKSVGETVGTKSPTVAETPPENADSVLPEVVNTTKSDVESDSKEVSRCEDKRESTEPVVEATESAQPEPEPETEASAPSKEEKKVERPNPDEDMSSIVLAAGVRAMARWTDKRYYSGVLRDCTKNDRWEVKFDDGTIKAVREDFIMPMEWLKVGSLVYALCGDNYASGQIVDIQRGEEVTFVVELDEEKKTVSAQSSDLCLSDLMAGIIKEKYKPLAGTPRKITDIDFDNVLSGKRRREQRTPSKVSAIFQHGNSEPRKTSTSRKKKDLQTVKETPEQSSTGKQTTGLKSEGGHLVEDKVASADSPSENEVGGTPLRSSSKDARGKAKPRILSYGYEVPRPRRGKLNQWLTEDGIPIPGPSGVKFKKKPRPKEDDADDPPKKKVDQEKSSPRALKANKPSGGSIVAVGRLGEEKGKKRRLDGVAEENVQKKTTRVQKSKWRK